MVGAWLIVGCDPPRHAEGHPFLRHEKTNASALIVEPRALADSIARRVSERAMTAGMATDQLTLLQRRASKVGRRCGGLAARSRVTCEAHFARLENICAATALSIGILRNGDALPENQLQVELWMQSLATGIDELDSRVDRVEAVAASARARPKGPAAPKRSAVGALARVDAASGIRADAR